MVVKFHSQQHCLIKCMVTLSVLYILQHKGAKTTSEQMLNEHTTAAYEMCAFAYSTLSLLNVLCLRNFKINYSHILPMKIQHEVHGQLARTMNMFYMTIQ